MHSPMEQFEIKRLIHLSISLAIDASFTNSAPLDDDRRRPATAVSYGGMRRRALVPGRLQSVAEIGYEFIAKMVARQCRRRRQEVLPLRPHPLPLRAGLQHRRPDPLLLHADQPHHRHLRHGRLRVHRRDHHRASPSTACTSSRSSRPRACRWADADPGADRDHLLPDPAAARSRSACSPTCWPATPC